MRERQQGTGAFYTLPSGAALLAGLAADAVIPWHRPHVWLDPSFWRDVAVLEPCVGTGELVVGWLLELRRRGASDDLLRDICRESVTCIDIDRDSCRITANRIQAPTWLMPWGIDEHGVGRIGVLEMLAQPDLFGGWTDLARKVWPEPGTEWMWLLTADEIADRIERE